MEKYAAQQPAADDEKVERLKQELEDVTREANERIELGNERIRSIRKDRDDAIEKARRLENELLSFRQQDSRGDAVLEKIREGNLEEMEKYAAQQPAADDE